MRPLFPEADSEGELAYRLWRRGLELTLAELASLGGTLPAHSSEELIAGLVAQQLLLCMPLLRRTQKLALLGLEEPLPRIHSADVRAVSRTAANTETIDASARRGGRPRRTPGCADRPGVAEVMMQMLHFSAIGCQMLAVVDAAGARAAERLRRVPGWFAAWERRLSRFRPDSELSRLNHSGVAPMRLSLVLAAALGAAQGAARMSGGLVTPMALAALEAAGYDRPFAELAPELARQAHAPLIPADWRQLHLDPTARTVTLPAGVRLDLGGTAKGWAAAEAARRLRSAGPALVDAGGDIVVSGPMVDGGPWPIAIASPFGEGDAPLGVLQLATGAVATSGRDHRRWRQGGEERHHLIDPRTGRPAETDVLAATVVAGDAVTAEAAAKVALMLGGRDGMAWVEARPGLAALLALDDGRVLQSRRLTQFLAPPEANWSRC